MLIYNLQQSVLLLQISNQIKQNRKKEASNYQPIDKQQVRSSQILHNNNSTPMSSTSQPLLPTQTSYPTALYIILPILIVYFAIYVLLRNHYIFKPQIVRYLQNSRIKYQIIKQLIVDILSSLSILTFTFSSILLSCSDHAISLLLQHDLYWMGLCISLIIYRNIKEVMFLQIKVVIKNAFILIFMYVILIEQYFSMSSFLIMGLVMIGVYLVNVMLKIYEVELVKLIEVLFNSKPQIITQNTQNNANQMLPLEFISTNFPVSRSQLEDKLRTFEPRLKKLKLKTRITVSKKLLLISLAVKLSQQKMISHMKKEVASYYGGLNGTTNEKMKRIRHDENKPPNEQTNHVIQETILNFQNRKAFNDEKKFDFQFEHSKSFTEDLVKHSTASEEIPIYGLDLDDELQVLFTIFPIKVFESSKIISTLFTLFLNLTFGFCLDYTLTILLTLKYGQYFNFLFALVILPVLPNISKNQYFNSMALASIWKYTLVGIFVVINSLASSIPPMNYSPGLKIQAIINIVMIIFVIIQVAGNSNNSFRLFLIFFLLLIANIALTYTQS